MNIALICDREKTQATIRFCKKYKDILKYNKIYIPKNLNDNLKNHVKFKLTETLYLEEEAKQQILSRIFYGEIDMLLFFRKPKKLEHQEKIDSMLLNLCDENLLPYATNFKTAEILLKSLI